MKPSTKRLLSFAAAFAFLLGALVVFTNLIRPAYGDLQELKAEIYSKEAALESERSAATQVQNLLEQYRGELSPQSALSTALPPTNDQAQTVHEVQQLATLHRLSVQSLAVSQPGSKPLTGQAGRGSASSTAVKPVGVIGAQVRVAGTYANFKSFLAALETNLHLTDIQSLVITPIGKPNQDFYNFDLALSNYFQNP